MKVSSGTDAVFADTVDMESSFLLLFNYLKDGPAFILKGVGGLMDCESPIS